MRRLSDGRAQSGRHRTCAPLQRRWALATITAIAAIAVPLGIPLASAQAVVFVPRLPAISATPVAAFAPQLFGTKSTPQQVTLTNTGSDRLVIATVTASTGFSASSGCTNVELLFGASCSFTVTFAPKAYGPVAGSLTITSNVPGAPQTIALSGAGIPAHATTLSLPVSSNVGSYASLNGSVVSQGPGTFYFEYGPSAAYGAQTPSVPLASSTASQLFEVTIPVAAGSSYHYRIVANNLAGTTYGADQVFSTPPDPPLLSSTAGRERLAEVLGQGLELSVGESSAATVGVKVSVTAKTAHAAHIISRSRTSDAPVVIGSATVSVTGGAPVSATVQFTGRDRSLLAKLPRVTFTLDADAVSTDGQTGSPTEFTAAVAR
jgi:hypothetical protein